MRTKLGALLVAAAVASASVLGGSLLVTEPWAGPGRHGYIVVTSDPTTVIMAAGVEPTYIYSEAIIGFAADLTEQEAEDLAAQPGVSVERDEEFTIFDDRLPTGVDRLDADRYWDGEDGTDATGLTGRGVTVAVLDTGLSFHPDLRIDTVLSRDFTYNDNGWIDGHGHGTHVAGIIAAGDNGTGMIGVAPGATVVALKVMHDSGMGSTSLVIAGIDWAIQHKDKIDVLNLSLGARVVDSSRCPSGQAFHQAFCNAVDAGLIVVAAAGNSNVDAVGFIPASYDEVITVSALADSDGNAGGRGYSTPYGPDDTLATFSNWGADVDLAAPGVNIESAAPGGATKKMSGTSMAAPHVAGLAALYVEAHGKPVNKAGVMGVRSGLVAGAAVQDGPCGMTGDRDGYAEPVARAVQGECGGPPEVTPTAVPTTGPMATPTAGPVRPPSDVTVRTECPGDEANVMVSWQDNSLDESWFGVYVTNEAGDTAVWRGSIEPDSTRFLWPNGKPGDSRTVIVGAYISGYQWSPWVPFTVVCPGGPQPTTIPTATPTVIATPGVPTPTPGAGCAELERLRDLLCEAAGILFPEAGLCK